MWISEGETNKQSTAASVEEVDETLKQLLTSYHNEESVQHFINFNEELSSSDKQTPEVRSRAAVYILLAHCHLRQLQFHKLQTSDLQDEIIRIGQKWMQLAQNLENLNKVFKYPCQELYLSEIRAQFHYLAGTCLLRRVHEKTVSEGDAISMATALYALSLREGSKSKKNLLKMNWKEEDATVVSRLSCVRVSQTWHFLDKLLELKGRDYFNHHQEKWCNKSGYQQMLNQVLGLHHGDGDDDDQWVTSLVSQLSFHPLSTKGIKSRENEIAEIDCECLINDQNSLPILVWTCMQWDVQDIERTPVFEVFMKKRVLQSSSSNLNNCSIRTLCILDLVLFLYAVANTMNEKLKQYLDLESIPVMNYPYLTLNLRCQQQIDWFNAVHQHLDVKGSSMDFIPVVEEGLKVLRCRSHKETMGTELLIFLGRKMEVLMLKYKGSEAEKKRYKVYQERCSLYWQEALNQLQKIQHGEDILEPRNPLFPHGFKKFDVSEVEELIEEASETLAECQPERGHTKTNSLAQLPYTPPTPVEERPEQLLTPSHPESDRRDRLTFSSDRSYQEPSYSGRTSTPSQRPLNLPTSNPGHSSRQQLPVSPHGYLPEPRHSTPAERTQISTPLRQSCDRTQRSQDQPRHSTPAQRTQTSTPPRRSGDRTRMSQDHLTPVDSFHPSLREEPSRGTPDGSTEPLYLPRVTPENLSRTYHSSIADDSNYEGEVANPSPQRLTHEIKDLNRSQHHHEAKTDEMKKIQRERHEKALNQNKQISNNNNKLTEFILELQEEQRQADIARMNTMSLEIGGLSDRLTDSEKEIQDIKSTLEDQNQKNVEKEQGLLALLENLKKRNKELEIRYELLKQNQAKLHEMFIKMTNELLRRQAIAQREQEICNTELKKRMGELQQNLREWETLRSDLKKMEQSVDNLYESFTGMATRIDEIDQNEHQTEESLRSIQENLKQSVRELKNSLAIQNDGIEEAVKDLEEKIEVVRKEMAKPTASVGPLQTPQQVRSGAVMSPTPEAYLQQNCYPHAVTYVPHPQYPDYLVSVQGLYPPGMMTSIPPVRRSDPSQTTLPGHSGIYEERGTPTDEGRVQDQQVLRGGPGMQSGGDPRGYVTRQEHLPSSQYPQLTPVVAPMRGMRATPPQYPSPSGQFTSVAQQPASPKNVGQRMEGSPSLTAHPTEQRQQQPSVTGNQPGSNLLAVPSSIGLSIPTAAPVTQLYQHRSPTPVSQSPIRQPVPPAGPAQSPFAGFSFKGTPSGVSHPTSQISEQNVSPSSTPKPGQDTTEPSSMTPSEPSVGQQESGLLNIPVRRPGESFIGTLPQTHERGDFTPGAISKGPAGQAPPSFGNPDISNVSFASVAAGGDADSFRRDPSKPFNQFPGAGAPVFGSPSTPHKQDENVAEDQEYDPHYDPIISLPANVDLTTGDEGQEVVFKERARLYRYMSDTQEWKERGVGDMKILRNPETGRTRILMRREQVLKVCANHWLKPGMELLPMSSSDRAWVWNAIDFAEGKECHEQFAIKFNTPDLAAKFKKTFDEMKEEAKPSFTKPVESVQEKPAESRQDTPTSPTEKISGHRFHQTVPVDPYSSIQLRSQEEEEKENDDKEEIKDENGEYYKEGSQQQQVGGVEEEGGRVKEERGIPKQQEPVPTVSDQTEKGIGTIEGEDKIQDLPEKKPKDRTAAVEPKETVTEPSKPTEDVKTKEKDEIKEAESLEEMQQEEKRKEKKETPPPVSEKTKEEDVVKKQETKLPSSEEKKPEDRRAAVEPKETEKEPSKSTEDVKTKGKDEVKEAGKDEESLEEMGQEEKRKEKKEPVPTVSDQTKEGIGTMEGEDKVQDLPEKKPEDRTPAVEPKETVKKPSKPTEDVKTKEEDEMKETGKDEETLKEMGQEEKKKERKETPPPVSEKTKEGDVGEKQETKPPSSEEKKPEDKTAAVEPKETVKEPSKPTEDVKTKEKDEIKEAGKDEESLEEMEQEEKRKGKKETPPPVSEKTKDEDVVKKQESKPPSSEADDKVKPEKFPIGKVESKGTVEKPSKPKEDVETKKKDELKEAGKDEESLKKEGKTEEEKKETSPVSPEKAKEEDVKGKKTLPSSKKDKSKGDVKSAKPADEETAKEEEKEEDPSREIKFSAPAELFYEDENKDWKLRAKGQFQILFDKENKNYQVEMKRDKDNILCARHPITKAIQLVPVRGSDRSYAWSAMDSSDKEGSPVSMVFSVRFKNRETADNFQEEFQKAQTPEVEASPAGKGKDKKEKKKESKKDKDKKDDPLHLSDPSLGSSQVSLTPSQASLDSSKSTPTTSSQPEDAPPKSPGDPQSPKDAETKKPEKKKKKKKTFFGRVKEKVTELIEGSDESDEEGSSSTSSSSESSSDEDTEKK